MCITVPKLEVHDASQFHIYFGDLGVASQCRFHFMDMFHTVTELRGHGHGVASHVHVLVSKFSLDIRSCARRTNSAQSARECGDGQQRWITSVRWCWNGLGACSFIQ